MKNKTHTGPLVRRLRLQAGLSQGKICRALGYQTPQYLSNIERGLCVFPARKAKKFCKLVKVDEGRLFAAMVDDYRNWLKREWGKK